MKDSVELYDLNFCKEIYQIMQASKILSVPHAEAGSFAYPMENGEVILIPQYSIEEVYEIFKRIVSKEPLLFHRYEDVFGMDHKYLILKKKDPLALFEAITYMLKCTI